ncbi:MAG: hypothetical protein ACI9IP_001622 [Arcticibacterium sp.]|jgi:hypothetical protein
MGKDKTLEEFLKNIKGEQAPVELKKEVFKSLDSMEVVIDIFDLFTAKFAKVETQFIDILTKEKKD